MDYSSCNCNVNCLGNIRRIRREIFKMKKAGVSFQAVVLILIIAGIVIALSVAYLLFLGPSGFQDKSIDSLCSIGASGRSSLKIANQHLFPELCKTRPKTVSANNWDECPFYKAQIEEQGEEEKDYYKKCAAEQFAKWMTKCWEIRGGGEANPGNFECYSICVSSEESIARANSKIVKAQNKYDIAKEVYDDANSTPYYHENGSSFTEKEREEALAEKLGNLNVAEEELKKAKKELEELEKEGVPTIKITLDDIKDAMKEATIEDKEKTYSEVLDPDKIGEADFWNNVLLEGSFLKAQKRKGLENTTSDGDVISIFFVDGWDASPFGWELLEAGKNEIRLRYKTSC